MLTAQREERDGEREWPTKLWKSSRVSSFGLNVSRVTDRVLYTPFFDLSRQSNPSFMTRVLSSNPSAPNLHFVSLYLALVPVPSQKITF